METFGNYSWRKDMKGFTLIELMIVIAIIAIIAAIAIPGLLQSQRASNERNASASLKTIGTAQADFRSNDRNDDGINNFLVADIQGLYTIIPGGGTDMIKLIEPAVARADCSVAAHNAAALGTQTPKAGYWYTQLDQYQDSGGVATNYDTAQPVAGFSLSKFGAAAVPDAYGSSGNLIFIMNEDATIYKRDARRAGYAADMNGTPVDQGALLVFPYSPTAGNTWSQMD
jgi:prepilin-type N-terminal cleavage/methylation domain-containing protein